MEESDISRDDPATRSHITPQILGYHLCVCGCGTLVLEQTYHATSGLSMECFIAGHTKELKELEVSNRGKRICVKIADKPKEKRYRGRRLNRRFVEQAQLRALRRLKMLYPEAYDLLYAEERKRIGLPPVIRHESGYLTAAAAKTNKVAKAYARTVNQGAKDA